MLGGGELVFPWKELFVVQYGLLESNELVEGHGKDSTSKYLRSL